MRCFSGSGKRRPLLGLPQGDGSLGPRDEVWGPMSCPRPGPEKAETALPGKQRPVGRLPERWPSLRLSTSGRGRGDWESLGCWRPGWEGLGRGVMTSQMTGEQTITPPPVPALWRSPPAIAFRRDCSNLNSGLCDQQRLSSYSPGKVPHQDPLCHWQWQSRNAVIVKGMGGQGGGRSGERASQEPGRTPGSTLGPQAPRAHCGKAGRHAPDGWHF